MAIIDATDNSSSAMLANILQNRARQRESEAEDIRGFRMAVFGIFDSLIKQGASMPEALAKMQRIAQIYPEKFQASLDFSRAQGPPSDSDIFKDTTNNVNANISRNLQFQQKNSVTPENPYGTTPAGAVSGFMGAQGINPSTSVQEADYAALTQGSEAGLTANKRDTGAMLTVDESADNERDQQRIAIQERDSQTLARRREVLNAATSAGIRLKERALEHEIKKANPEGDPKWVQKEVAKSMLTTLEKDYQALLQLENDLTKNVVGQVKGLNQESGLGSLIETRSEKGARRQMTASSDELKVVEEKKKKLQEKIQEYTIKAGGSPANPGPKPDNPLAKFIEDDQDGAFLDEE